MKPQMQQELSLCQSLKISGKMIQSINVLQMDAFELDVFLYKACLENPILEPFVPPSEPLADTTEQRREWLSRREYVGERVRSGDEYNFGEAGRFVEEENPSLEKHLFSQAKDILDLNLQKDVCRLIFFIEPDGYVRLTAPELEEETGLSAPRLGAAFEALQRMEPAGVGARSLQECLLLQISPLQHIAREMVLRCLNEMAQQRFGEIAVFLRRDEADVERAYRFIQTLNPKPGLVYQPNQPAHYIIPDIIVYIKKNSPCVLMNKQSHREVVISGAMLKLVHSTTDESTRVYLKEKLRQAETLAKHVGDRGKTLESVASEIVWRQRAFFSGGGAKSLICLRIYDVAARLHLHPSTVSRAIKGKYLQARAGVFPLRYFFSGGTVSDSKDSSTGGYSSSHAIKARILELAGLGGVAKPLSDARIVAVLAKEGCVISRRTVAKYRGMMGVKCSFERK